MDKSYSPAIDPVYFPGTFSYYYWTSTIAEIGNPDFAWAVNFADGYIFAIEQDYSAYDQCLVRCVR